MTSFGFGQRTCLGQSVTQDELVVACGALCWAFDLKKKIDPATGREIEIDYMKSNSLLIVKPDAFQMAFHPRTEERKQLILRQWEEADRVENAAIEKFRSAGAKAAEVQEKVDMKIAETI